MKYLIIYIIVQIVMIFIFFILFGKKVKDAIQTMSESSDIVRKTITKAEDTAKELQNITESVPTDKIKEHTQKWIDENIPKMVNDAIANTSDEALSTKINEAITTVCERRNQDKEWDDIEAEYPANTFIQMQDIEFERLRIFMDELMRNQSAYYQPLSTLMAGILFMPCREYQSRYCGSVMIPVSYQNTKFHKAKCGCNFVDSFALAVYRINPDNGKWIKGLHTFDLPNSSTEFSNEGMAGYFYRRYQYFKTARDFIIYIYPNIEGINWI